VLDTIAADEARHAAFSLGMKAGRHVRQTRQTDRQKQTVHDRQTGRQTGRQTDRQMRRQARIERQTAKMWTLSKVLLDNHRRQTSIYKSIYIKYKIYIYIYKYIYIYIYISYIYIYAQASRQTSIDASTSKRLNYHDLYTNTP
jgi:hypothetical protein